MVLSTMYISLIVICMIVTTHAQSLWMITLAVNLVDLFIEKRKYLQFDSSVLIKKCLVKLQKPQITEFHALKTHQKVALCT